MRKRFAEITDQATYVLGSPWSVLGAIALIVGWLVTGPIFQFSDTWQLVINTTPLMSLDAKTQEILGVWSPFVVIDPATGERLKGIPTPLLVSQGGGEAYLEEGWQWRARDDVYDRPGTIYHRVRVVRNTDPSPYDDPTTY